MQLTGPAELSHVNSCTLAQLVTFWHASIFVCMILSCLYPEVHFPGGCFSMSAIVRLAAVANINLCYELAPKHREMIEKLSLPQSLSHNQSPTDAIMVVINEWLAGKTSVRPTWSKMMAVLREIGMIDLAVRIERYLGTTLENGSFLAHVITIVLLCQNDDRLFLP